MSAKTRNFFIFYTVTIAAVIVLFNVVTTYGETQLKAPQFVAGNYRLNIKESPQCLGSGNINLNIEQSGIYLFGSLSINEQQVVLDGKIDGDRISLSGQADRIAQCQPQDNSSNDIAIEGQAQERTFSGKINWNFAPQELNFTGTLEKSLDRSEPEH
jgi:hypothetical protein